MEFIKQDDKVIIECLCNSCGGIEAKLCEGKGPHIAELKCEACGRHVQWMPKGAYEVYQCYLTDNPYSALLDKLKLAEDDFKKVDVEGDWIERKTAKKTLDTLKSFVEKFAGESVHFTAYGHE